MLKYWEELPPVFTTSSESGFGKEPLLNYIEQILA
jgi:GTP-binding protein